MAEVAPAKKRSHTRKLLATWLLVVLTYGGYMAWKGYSPTSIIENSVDWLRDDPMGPLIYVIAYLTRSITLVPASALSVVAGYCYGATRGCSLAMASGILAGLMVYSLGRRLGGPPLRAAGGVSEVDDSRWAFYREKLRTNGFTTTVLMRWLMLPYDPGSYLCGSIGVSRGTFLLATIIGNLPGTLTCALFGAGIHGRFNGQTPHMERIYELCGAGLLALMLGLTIQHFRPGPRQISAEAPP